jgi:hypothetical protein
MRCVSLSRNRCSGKIPKQGSAQSFLFKAGLLKINGPKQGPDQKPGKTSAGAAGEVFETTTDDMRLKRLERLASCGHAKHATEAASLNQTAPAAPKSTPTGNGYSEETLFAVGTSQLPRCAPIWQYQSSHPKSILRSGCYGHYSDTTTEDDTTIVRLRG